MARNRINKRLKISHQLLIVFFFAVFLPLFIAGFVVTNVNQHAIRDELRYSVAITLDNVNQRLQSSIEEEKLTITYLAKSLKYIYSPFQTKKLLKEIEQTSKETVNIEIIKKNLVIDIPKIIHDKRNGTLIFYEKIDDKRILKQIISLKKLENRIFESLENEKRQIYIVDTDKNILMSFNKDEENFKNNFKYNLKEIKTTKPFTFGSYKNRPNSFLKIEKLNWAIVVMTPKQLAKYSIVKSRYKIILILLITAITIIVLGALYSISLNTNIKQLLKTISAIKRGNYRKRIRLIKNFLSPFEVLFLAEEFNKMVIKIDNSYKELQQANKQLAKLDEIKSNLIDTVSHEFRTPLTSIKGYTSRLLRTDIEIDEETRIKSLKVIKQQTEKLNRLVEDLLVIPDIESDFLRIYQENINIKELIEDSINLLQHKNSNEIILNGEENFPLIYADKNRTEQIISNLIDNAIKYSCENSKITISMGKLEKFAQIKIHNETDREIKESELSTLFKKFSRLDSSLTRTTRGTGLGLFIVKGLIEAMGGKIELSNKNGFEVTFTLPLIEQEEAN